jgi:hypothetical protein
MEPAIRSLGIEPGISTDQAQKGSVLAQRAPNIPEFSAALAAVKSHRGERNFWVRRREAETGLRDCKCPRRPKDQNDTGGKSPQKRPVLTRPGNLRFGGTGWWSWKGPNCQPPTQSSNRSPPSESGTEFFAAETGRQNGPIHPDCGSSRVLRGLFTAYRCRERVSFSAKRFRALFISGCVGGSDWLAKRS